MTDDHLTLLQSESSACLPTEWEKWIEEVEAGLGHSADGDQSTDGYSLDAYYQMWERGVPAQDAIASTARTTR